MDIAIPIVRAANDGFHDFVYPKLKIVIIGGQVWIDPTHGMENCSKKASPDDLKTFAWSRASVQVWGGIHPVDKVIVYTDMSAKVQRIFDHKLGIDDKLKQWQSKCKAFLLRMKIKRSRQLAIVMATHLRLGDSEECWFGKLFTPDTLCLIANHPGAT